VLIEAGLIGLCGYVIGVFCGLVLAALPGTHRRWVDS
jgi:hypothetical protein